MEAAPTLGGIALQTPCGRVRPPAAGCKSAARSAAANALRARLPACGGLQVRRAERGCKRPAGALQSCKAESRHGSRSHIGRNRAASALRARSPACGGLQVRAEERRCKRPAGASARLRRAASPPRGARLQAPCGRVRPPAAGCKSGGLRPPASAAELRVRPPAAVCKSAAQSAAASALRARPPAWGGLQVRAEERRCKRPAGAFARLRRAASPPRRARLQAPCGRVTVLQGGIAAWKPLPHWAVSRHGSRSHIGRNRSMEAAPTLGGIAAWKPLSHWAESRRGSRSHVTAE